MKWSLCGWHELHQLVSTSDTSHAIPSTRVTGVLCRCKGVHERWLLCGIWLQQWAIQRLLCVSTRVQWVVLWNRYVVLGQRHACTYVHTYTPVVCHCIPDVSACRPGTVYAALWQLNLLQRRVPCVQWLHWDLFVSASLHRAVLRECCRLVWESRVLL